MNTERLSQWAKRHNFSYMAAWRMFNRNEIPGAYKLDSGSIVISNEIKLENKIIKLIDDLVDTVKCDYQHIDDTEFYEDDMRKYPLSKSVIDSLLNLVRNYE